VLVLLLVAGTLGALRTSSPSAPSSQRSAIGVTHGVATTTVPPSEGAGSAPSFGATVPSPAQSANGGAATATGGTTGSAPDAAPALPNDAVGQSAKIEQTGTLGLTVRRGGLAHAMAALSLVASANGGFVASSQTESGALAAGVPSGTITLQVPVATFSTALRQAQSLGRTSDLTTRATDVSGQYVDLTARIAALEASRQQYLTIMAKATSVGDVLAVQSQLDSIQSQIEQLQGQLQVLTSETAYSTLTIQVSEGHSAGPPPPGPQSGLSRAWHDSVSGFVDGVEGVIRAAGPVLFALLCLAVLLVGGRALWRRYQRHNL
jgi:hypothetical protein